MNVKAATLPRQLCAAVATARGNYGRQRLQEPPPRPAIPAGLCDASTFTAPVILTRISPNISAVLLWNTNPEVRGRGWGWGGTCPAMLHRSRGWGVSPPHEIKHARRVS